MGPLIRQSYPFNPQRAVAQFAHTCVEVLVGVACKQLVQTLRQAPESRWSQHIEAPNFCRKD
jgi:hypothetical protein